MKATGIVRRIDDLGRIVVPKEIRRTLRIREGDPLEILQAGRAKLCSKILTGWGTGRVCTKLCTGTGTDHRGSGLHYGSGICDRSSGNREKEVEGEQLSEEMEEMIEKRSTVVKTGEEQACSITKKQCQPFRRELCFQVFCAMETVRVL